MEEAKEIDVVIGSMQENAMLGNAEYSPSLTSAMGMGGGQIPMVVERTEVEELGFIDKGTGKHQSNVVYDKEGLSPCICAALGVKQPPTMTVEQSRVVVQKCGDRDKEGSYSVHDYSNTIPANPMSDRGQMLVEQTCVAMRGRNPENPSDRTSGIELEQRLEINDTGCTNTLTTVQEDNLVLEKSSFPLRMVRTEEGKALRKDYEAGNIHHGFNEYREPECRTDGVSNTVTTVQKDTLLLEKEQVLAYDEQNQTVRTETFGTLTTDGSSPKHNNRVIKIKQATKQGFIECEIGGVFCSEYPTSELRRGRVIENGQISPTLTTESIPDRIELGNPDFYNFLYEIDGEIYLIRIRKLIPLECWRLMGFTDEDFKKAEKVNSNTQLYKQAGNSIVCDCLEAIFSQMNIKGVTPWNEKQEFTYQGQ